MPTMELSDRQRLQYHNARKHADGITFQADHAPRNFDTSKAPHIDPSRTHLNKSWTCCEGIGVDQEMLYYERTFSAALEKRNKKKIEQRHKKDVRDMDWYYNYHSHQPERVLIGYGHYEMKDDTTYTMDPEELWSIWQEQVAWEEKTFPQVKYLNFFLHLDEHTPHIEAARVWIAYDEEGIADVGQNRALEQMGVPLPEPPAYIGPKPQKKDFATKEDYDLENAAWKAAKAEITAKYNRKVVYSAMCREHFFDLLKEHGYDPIIEPRDPKESGMTLESYKQYQELKYERDDLQAEKDSLEQERRVFGAYRTSQKRSIAEKLKNLQSQTEEMAKLKEQLEFAFDEIIATYKRVKARSNDRALPVSERLIASRQAADIRQQVQEDLGTNIDEYIENMEEER